MVRWLLSAWLLIGLSGCPEECVDQFDCLRVPSKLPLTCDDGRCVVKTSLPMIPSFVIPDAGRPDAGAGGGASGDGGLPVGRLLPGEYTARLSGGQLVPPVTTTASGQATATLLVDDAGLSTLSFSVTLQNVTPTNVVLMTGAPAGRTVFSFLPLDGGVASPFAGATRLSRAQAEAVSAYRAAFLVTSVGRPMGELRGQLVPRGAFVGFTQFVRSDTGGYGGGGQLVLETLDGGFIPQLGSFDFDWTESGPVASAVITQGGGGPPIVTLPLNATATGSVGSFDPLALLFNLRDAGIAVVGTGLDGGERFRGDLGLSLR